MRVSAVAICTLAALSSKDLTQAAIASPVPPAPPDDWAAQDATAEAVEPVLPIAPPETLDAIAPTSHPKAAIADRLKATAIAPPEAAVPERAMSPALPAAAVLAAPALEPFEPLENSAPERPAAPAAVVAAPIEVEPAIAPPAAFVAEPEAAPTSYSAADLAADGAIVAQAASTPSAADVEELQQRLEDFAEPIDFGDELEGAPAITLSNPSGYGADNFTGFVNFGYQAETRFGDVSDGSLGVGMGFGDARRNVGVQLSYTIASFGGSREFGAGGFNAKIHRQFPGGLSIAAGWDGFLTTGDVDFEDSIYGSATQIIRTRPDIDDPFSRIALTAGVGSGRFRSEADFTADNDTVGVFGSVAVRVARPVSVIAEWTGQDLAIGASVAPIRDFPLVITPALRDITGAGDGARFVLGVGVSFQL